MQVPQNFLQQSCLGFTQELEITFSYHTFWHCSMILSKRAGCHIFQLVAPSSAPYQPFIERKHYRVALWFLFTFHFIYLQILVQNLKLGAWLFIKLRKTTLELNKVKELLFYCNSKVGVIWCNIYIYWGLGIFISVWSNFNIDCWPGQSHLDQDIFPYNRARKQILQSWFKSWHAVHMFCQ